MATKRVALGTVLAVDTAGGSTYVTVTLAIDATPPSRTWAKIDQTALSDTLATNAPGIEEHSQYVFNQYWHPTDTMHATLDTLAAAKTDGAWKITYPFSATIADTFTGWISGLEPAALQANGMIMRKVTIERTSAITRT